jgi:hypothetical protein
MRYEARNTYVSRPGVCMEKACERYGEVVEVKVSKFGRPVCCECEGDDVFDDDGFPFTGARDFRYAL